MAQFSYRANLSTDVMPFCSRYCGRTVIQPQLDQNYLQTVSLQGEKEDRGNPEVYYIHDVMPTKQGIKSVAYQKVIEPAANVTTFDKMLTVRDSSNNIGFIGITTDGRSFLISTYTDKWIEVTPAGQPANAVVSTANVTGNSFICYSGFGIYTVDLKAATLTSAMINWGTSVNASGSSVTNSSISCITDCYNILLATDGYTVYSSSATNPLDMNPANGQITGAQNFVPADIHGPIIAIVKCSVGWLIMTNNNMVTMQWSNNIQYPWIARPTPNGGGIKSINAVTTGGPDGTVYAWTSSGMQQVSLMKADNVFPGLSDYLSSRFFEDWNDVTNAPFETIISSDMDVRVQWTGNRFLCVSYGPLSLQYCYVFDTALKQWGKLRMPHVAIADFTIKADGNKLSYSQIAGESYSNLYSVSYSELTSISGDSASPRRTLGILQHDGTVLIPVLDEYNFTASAVALLGYYRVMRQNYCTIQEIIVENIDTQSYSFSLEVLSSLRDSPVTYNSTFTTTDTINVAGASSIVDMYGYAVGLDHTLLLKGSFSLVSLELWMTLDGRR
jgi:hypothetical protein